MNTERIDPQMTGTHDAVVTYSRIPSRGVTTRNRGSAVSAVERVEPTLTALAEVREVRLTDPHDDADPAFALARPDFRADSLDADPAPAGSTRYVVFGAAFAILAGVGVLAASVGIATIVPGNAPVESELTAAPALRLTSSEPAAEAVPVSPLVREIPLSAGEEAPAAAAVAPAPPVPRPRPEDGAPVEPGSDVASAPVAPTPTPVVAKVPDPKPAESDAGVATPTAIASVESQPQPQPQAEGTDKLITNIEETLAKIDTAPAGTSAASIAVESPPVLPPPVALEPSAATVLPPTYPPVYGDCAPTADGFDPCYDVMPPEPLASTGYPTAPIPPEPVPFPYPSDNSGSFDNNSGSFDSGAGSGNSGDSTASNDSSDSSSAHGPGIVRRTIKKTADRVSRVLSRDR